MTLKNWKEDLYKHSPAELISIAEEAAKTLEQALMNEGKDGCTRPIIGWCKCWRCRARKIIEKINNIAG